MPSVLGLRMRAFKKLVIVVAVCILLIAILWRSTSLASLSVLFWQRTSRGEVRRKLRDHKEY